MEEELRRFKQSVQEQTNHQMTNTIKTEQELLKGVNKVEKKVPTVYQISDDNGFNGYVKITTPSEMERTRMVQTIIDGNTDLRVKNPNIEIEYPHIISDDLSILPTDIQEQINDQIQNAAKVNSSRTNILTDPNSTKFIMSSVDTGGDLTFSKMDTDFNELHDIIMQHLNNQPITKTEWDEIQNIVREMNDKGFTHGDLGPNMFLKRNPSTGKLKVTFIDFELPPGGQYAKDEDILQSFQSLLSQYGAFAF